MTNKKKDYGYVLGKMLKERDNPKEFKPCEAVVTSLSPLKLSVLNGQIDLIEDDNLIISEWFVKRSEIDKTKALSENVPELLKSASSIIQGAVHSNGGASCVVIDAVDKLSQAITKVNDELFTLKMDLKVKDKVIVVPSAITDVFILIDKV